MPEYKNMEKSTLREHVEKAFPWMKPVHSLFEKVRSGKQQARDELHEKLEAVFPALVDLKNVRKEYGDFKDETSGQIRAAVKDLPPIAGYNACCQRIREEIGQAAGEVKQAVDDFASTLRIDMLNEKARKYHQDRDTGLKK